MIDDIPLPSVDFTATWASLSPEWQRTVGRLVIEEAFLRFAASVVTGDAGEPIVYLDDHARALAEDEADEISRQVRETIESALPQLFGLNPSPMHPAGTDPPWATPMVRHDLLDA